MAQNITLMGATYSAVPAVELPKDGGGTATFTDVTDTTAAADDVATGKYFYTSAGVKTAGTRSGGGGGDYEILVDPDSQVGVLEVGDGVVADPNYTPGGDIDALLNWECVENKLYIYGITATFRGSGVKLIVKESE